jgi:hypothetical protein
MKGEDTPAGRVRSEARKREAREAMASGLAEHTVEVEVSPIEWGDHDRLVDLHEMLTARPELRGRRSPPTGVTVTVEAPDPATAHAIADNALAQELATLGFGRA